MIVFMTLCYTGVIFALAKLKIVPWNTYTKASPVGFLLVCLVALFIPMQWGAPSGGLIAYRYSVSIVPNVAGQVTEVPVAPNLPIHKGDVLFRIDPSPFQDVVDSKKAALAEAEQGVPQLKATWDGAQAGVAQATANRDRTKQSYERYRTANVTAADRVAQPFSDLEVENRRLVYEGAEAALKSAVVNENKARQAYESEIGGVNTTVARLRADVRRAEYDLTQTVVRAPSDGFVTNVTLREGARVTTLPLSPAMAFIDTSEVILGVQVMQIFARHIKPGQLAEVVLKSNPGEVLRARVVALLPATAQGQATVSGTARTAADTSPGPFFVRLALEDKATERNLVAGSAGSAAIYTSSVKFSHAIRKVMMRMQTYVNFINPV